MLLTNLYVVLQPMLAAGLLALAGYLTVWINGKVKNEKAAAIINRTKDLVFAVVKKANQTIVNGIKEASADGTITAEEKTKIKNAVLADLKEILGPTGLMALAYALGISGSAGALDKWLDTQIEAAVHDVKLVAAAASPAASVLRSISPTAPSASSACPPAAPAGSTSRSTANTSRQRP